MIAGQTSDTNVDYSCPNINTIEYINHYLEYQQGTNGSRCSLAIAGS